jgi:acetyltransferase-like isoleucine patch superfamily enzyme
MTVMNQAQPGYWTGGKLPENVRVGSGTVLTGDIAFKRFRSRVNPALTIGSNATMDGVQFSVGTEGRVEIGEFCYFTSAVLLCELELVIGSYVVLGWNTTIVDADCHPVDPVERIADAIACSPLGLNRARPAFAQRAITIESDVWIGPNATILKGVRIGQGAIVEPGSLVTHDVPPFVRVMGNPAHVVGAVERR